MALVSALVTTLHLFATFLTTHGFSCSAIYRYVIGLSTIAGLDYLNATWRTFLMTLLVADMATLKLFTAHLFTMLHFSSTKHWRIHDLLSTWTWNWLVSIKHTRLTQIAVTKLATQMLSTRQSFVALMETEMVAIFLSRGTTKLFAFVFLACFGFVARSVTLKCLCFNYFWLIHLF